MLEIEQIFEHGFINNNNLTLNTFNIFEQNKVS